MTLRTLIITLQVIVATSIAGLTFTSSLNLGNWASTLKRVQMANQQLQAMSRLAVNANRYSEQIAEVLLIGDGERPDFESARRGVREAFAWLRPSIEAEIAFVTGEEQAVERRELARLDRMVTLFDEIDQAAETLFRLDRDGRREDAVVLFRQEIENRLDAEFERLIAEGVAGERREVAEAEAEAARRVDRLRAVTSVTAVLLVLATVAASVVLVRSIDRPIAALAEGAQAIGRGDLGHRIHVRSRNELALLARRFNLMARQIQDQHDALRAAQSDLKRQVEERTHELSQANRRLRETDQIRVKFLADVSHELRTPLTVLRGEAEVALRGPRKPEPVYREALARIIEQAADMGRFVEDLLLLARAEVDEVRFERVAVDLEAIAREAVRDASLLADGRSITLDVAPGDLAVVGDPRRLRQALLIPLDNALKYADGTAPISVRVSGAEEASVVISIRDGGPGIPPEDLPHVFDRFFRGEDAVARASGGGLGLAIARWIVEGHGGDISIASRRGGETTVTIRLPAGGAA